MLNNVKMYVFRAVGSNIHRVLLLAILIINPFGMKSATEQESSDLFQNIASFFYPSKGQKEITIILIDDKSLGVSKERFYPSFRYYSNLVDKIFDMGAEAILLDFNLVDHRGSPSDLVDLARRLSEHKRNQKPVFMISTELSTRMESCNQVHVRNFPELQEAIAFEPHPMARDDARHIDLVLDDACERFRPAASLSLYAHYCSLKEDCRESVDDPVFNQPGFDGRVLSVEWGSVLPKGVESYHDTYKDLPSSCPRGGVSGAYEELIRFFGVLFTFGDNPRRSVFEQGCSYHPLIRAEWLLRPEETGANTASLGGAIAGRTVLVGLNMVGHNDIGRSPVFGDVPGVFIHAMALDNLIVHGARFLEPWPAGGIGGLGLSGVVEIGLILLFTPVGRRLKGCVSPQGLGQGLLWMLLFLTGGIILGLVTTAALVWGFRFEPINWIGIILACTVIAAPIRETLGKLWHAFCSSSLEKSK
jgi:CHASE2 domain-containing sensor protein